MSRSVLLAALLASILPVQAQIPGPERALTLPGEVSSPAAPGATAVPLPALYGSAQASGAAWLADGSGFVMAGTQGGSMQLWRTPLDGEAVQLTDVPGPKQGLRMTPDGTRIVYQADIGGRALHDLFSVPLDGGTPVNLTGTPEINETNAVFSSDGRWLAYSAREASGSNDNLRVQAVDGGTPRALTAEAESGIQWAAVAFSADGRTLIANRYDYGLAFGEVFAIDLDSGAATRLTPEGRYHFASAATPDASRIAISAEADSGLRQAAVLERASGTIHLIAPGEWEQKSADISPDGRQLLFTANENGREALYLHALDGGDTRRLDVPTGVNAPPGYVLTLPAFSPDGRQVLFPHGSGTRPLDYWTYALDDDRATRRTSLSALQDLTLPQTSIVNYASFDDTVISAVLWMPPNLPRDGSAPAVVIAHGGPTGQVMDYFHQAATALASRGYVVLAPNFRGSTGYGQAFLKANYLDLGGGDLRDLVAGVEFLAGTGYVDRARVGIQGGSYGGYMVLMALAKTDAFAAGVDMFGIVDWRTMWERSAPQNRRYQASLVGEPDTHAEVYDRASPMTFLDGVTAPLLVLHGENDTIVPAHESRQVVDFLQARGRPVEARFFAEEGHGFFQPANQREALERTVAWFDTHLAAPADPAADQDAGR